MRYRISQIRTEPGKSPEEALRRAVSRKSRAAVISNIEIVRESVDARKKPDVKLVYTMDFDCARRLPFDKAVKTEYQRPEPRAKGGPRPVVAGFGPCGIFAALILAEAGLKPIVVERGKAVDERVADVERFWRDGGAPEPESNVQFGEGGAGTFSDGKLTTGIKDVRIRKVLEEFVKAGADPEILYKHKPHIGTDRLRDIVKNLRLRIRQLGGEVRFGARLERLETAGENLRAVYISEAAETARTETRIETDTLIIAVGHSARDTFEMLRDSGFAMEQKPFSIGVRIEHPQEMINRVQYADAELAKIIGPAEYKLSYRCSEDCPENIRGRGVYTFCMCPGGSVVNASVEANTSVTNGMSGSKRDGEYANSALLVDVRTSDFTEACSTKECGTAADDPLAGMEFQRKYEQLAWENRGESGMAKTVYGKFRSDENDPVRRSLPAFASEAIIEAMPHLAGKLKGFDRSDARLTAVESRSSSAVRVLRDENMQIKNIGGGCIRGVIPAGEGPGYAGGIMSAAVDGIKAAEKIILLK